MILPTNNGHIISTGTIQINPVLFVRLFVMYNSIVIDFSNFRGPSSIRLLIRYEHYLHNTMNDL